MYNHLVDKTHPGKCTV